MSKNGLHTVVVVVYSPKYQIYGRLRVNHPQHLFELGLPICAELAIIFNPLPRLRIYLQTTRLCMVEKK